MNLTEIFPDLAEKIEIWSKAYPEEALKRLPTVFDLHETELHHQERMKKLYYTLAKRSGFEKKEKMRFWLRNHNKTVLNWKIDIHCYEN